MQNSGALVGGAELRSSRTGCLGLVRRLASLAPAWAGGASLSLGQKLQAADNRPSGFDYLRTSLAVAVIFWHSVLVSYGQSAEAPLWQGWARPIGFIIVPAFFALSGFLVAGSLLRNSTLQFLTLRVLRIYPALSCEVLISAILIGPALCQVSWRDYFGSREFLSYLLNVIGYIHYYLPGVFLTNPAGRYVNLQLWTIPYELKCYVVITILAVAGIVKRPILFALVIVGLTVPAIWRDGRDLLPFSHPPGRLLILAFLWGVLLYLWREKIPYSKWAFAASLVGSCLLLAQPQTACLAALPVAYLTVWLGLQNPRRTVLIAGADYSYGVYLYGFPVQQTLAYVFPQYRVWYVNGMLSVALAGVAAYLSWNLVESRLMRRKREVLAAVDRTAAYVRCRLWPQARGHAQALFEAAAAAARRGTRARQSAPAASSHCRKPPGSRAVPP